ncbi:MAG: sensor histidine kinase [Sphingomonas sp.]|uniref:sensor histidine kinase n=1 Tax=Sphingomonas sp. TaxID=28214 RepID=UPI0025DA929E|nr:sensor histidine kinase [Sphingomonas sp.]MBY0284067.1 sensor histidine kinase [Sphingomonas sp.]
MTFRWLVVLLFGFMGTSARGQQVDPRLTQIEQSAASPVDGQDNLAISARAEALSVDLAARHQTEPAARALRYAGVLAMMAEDHRRAIPLFDRSAALCRAAADQACLGRALNNAAVAEQAAGGLLPSLARLRAAAAAFGAAGEAELAATTRFNAANVQLALGDTKGALDGYLAIERDYPRSTFALGLLTNKAAALLALDQLTKAEQSANAALLLANSAQAREGYLADMRIVNLGTLAESAARRPNRAVAFARLEDAQALARRGGDRDRLNAALACLEVYARLGIAPDARACAETVERLRELEDEATQARALHLAATTFVGLGDYRRGASLQRLAYEAVANRRRSELAVAAALAVADVGMTERDTLVDSVQGQRDAARALTDRLWLFGAAAIGALVAGAIAVFAWLLVRQRRRRDDAVIEERTRVARDLHDTALQGFMAVTMQLQAAARTAAREDAAALPALLSALARDAGASLAQVRNAVWQMRSPMLASGDLRAAIADWLESRRNDQAGIDIDLDGLPGRLGQVKAEALLRVVQEAVNNAIIHGEARKMAVGAHSQDGKLVMTIVDNGKGFEPTDAAAMGGHWGLLGMRERIEALGGTLAIDSAPGRGTTITAIIPA